MSSRASQRPPLQCSVGCDAGLVTHEIRLQRGLIREDRVTADVGVVAQKQLRDQRLVTLGVEPEVHVLGRITDRFAARMISPQGPSVGTG